MHKMNSAQLTESKAKRERVLKIIISTFIILFVGTTLAWLSPEKIALRKLIVEASTGVFKFAGLWQGWELFAPNIRNVNSHTIALISFDDGSLTAWPLPRFEQMGAMEKFRKDKFRKWNGDNVQWDRYKDFWPAFARYVGRLHYNGSGAKPVSCTLMMFQTTVPGPTSHVSRAALPQHDQPKFSFFYVYKDGDLAI
jgi:hypothetical protein